MLSGYIENEIEFLILNIEKLVQAELDRYFSSCQLIQDYYAIVDGKELTNPPESLLFDLLPVGDVIIFKNFLLLQSAII